MEMTRAQTEVRRVALDPHREAAQALVEVVMVVPVAHVRREMESAQPGFPVRKVTAPTATDQLVNKGIVLTAVAHKGIAPSVPVIAHTAVALKETDLLVRKATAHMAAALKVIAHSVPVTVPMATDLLVPRVTAHMAVAHKGIVPTAVARKVTARSVPVTVPMATDQLVRKATAHMAAVHKVIVPTAAVHKVIVPSVPVTGHTAAVHKVIVPSVPVTVPMATDPRVPKVTAHTAAVLKATDQLVRKATAHTAVARKVTARSDLVTGDTAAAHREIVLTAVAHKVNVSHARAIGIASARGSKTPPRSRCLQVGVELPVAALARSN